MLPQRHPHSVRSVHQDHIAQIQPHLNTCRVTQAHILIQVAIYNANLVQKALIKNILGLHIVMHVQLANIWTLVVLPIYHYAKIAQLVNTAVQKVLLNAYNVLVVNTKML